MSLSIHCDLKSCICLSAGDLAIGAPVSRFLLPHFRFRENATRFGDRCVELNYSGFLLRYRVGDSSGAFTQIQLASSKTLE